MSLELLSATALKANVVVKGAHQWLYRGWLGTECFNLNQVDRYSSEASSKAVLKPIFIERVYLIRGKGS